MVVIAIENRVWHCPFDGSADADIQFPIGGTLRLYTRANDILSYDPSDSDSWGASAILSYVAITFTVNSFSTGVRLQWFIETDLGTDLGTIAATLYAPGTHTINIICGSMPPGEHLRNITVIAGTSGGVSGFHIDSISTDGCVPIISPEDDLQKLDEKPDEAGYSIAENQGSIASADIDGGLDYSRRDEIGGTRFVNLQWSGQPKRFQKVRDFFIENVGRNCEQFLLDLIIATSEYQEYVCNIDPDSIEVSTPQGKYWVIKATLEVEPRDDETEDWPEEIEAHRYWRVTNLSGGMSSGALDINELAFYFGANPVDTGTVTLSSNETPVSASLGLGVLIDGIFGGTDVYWQSINSGTFWIKWDFGENNLAAVDGFKYGEGGTGIYMCNSLDLEFSDDNTNWIHFGSASDYAKTVTSPAGSALIPFV